jgi:putative ABC transport system permease protein
MRAEHWLLQIPLRLRSVLRREQVEQELEEEFRFHLEQLSQENVAKGMSADQARQAALRAMDGLQQQKERCRDARGVGWIEHAWQDLRFGVRMLRKNPGFTLVAVCALALGIGANSAIYSVIYGVLLRPLPYADSDRIVVVYTHFTPQNMKHGTMSVADYLDLKAQTPSLESPALVSNNAWRSDLSGIGDPVQVGSAGVTPNFFSVLGVKPLLGRVLNTGEDSSSSARVAVVSERLWRNHFRADPSIVGRAVSLDGAQYTIVGVMPTSFRFWPETEVWRNLRIAPPSRRGPFPFIVIGRLKAGATLAQLQAETNSVATQVERKFPESYSQLTYPVVTLREATVGDVKPALWIIFGAVVFVLLISTVNVANLLLARAQVREREIAIRAALGAARGRLIYQLLTESTLLAMLGGVAGLAVAEAGLSFLRLWNPGDIPRLGEIRLDMHVLLFTLGVSLATGILFGVVPALQWSRESLNASLQEGGMSKTESASRHRTNMVLASSQVALSFVLLIGAGLLLRSFMRLQDVSTGSEAPSKNVFTVQVSSSKVSNGTPNSNVDREGIARYERLLDQVKSVPGVEFVSLSDSLPPNKRWDWDTFQVEGLAWSQAAFPASTAPTVDTDYFRALGIPLVAGRSFNSHDNLDSPPVCIISRTLARRYFGSTDPVGHHLKQSGVDLSSTNPWMTIVGVVGDVKYTGLNSEPEPAFYLPAQQNYSNRMYLVIRSNVRADILQPAVLRTIREFDSNLVTSSPSSLDQMISDSLAQPRFRTGLLALFSAIAVLLAAIGVYGVIAYSVVQRSHEIGIRMALGAQRSQVLRMVMKEGLRLMTFGLGSGVLLSLGLNRLMSDLLFQVQPTDQVTFFSVALLLCLVALLACAEPARRATRVDPMRVLRYE